jgi:hypothetical protein
MSATIGMLPPAASEDRRDTCGLFRWRAASVSTFLCSVLRWSGDHRNRPGRAADRQGGERRRAVSTLRENCVTGITANTERLAAQTGSFVGVITALIPHIGYGAASKLAKEALVTNANIADLVVSSGLMTRKQVAEMLTPDRLTRH